MARADMRRDPRLRDGRKRRPHRGRRLLIASGLILATGLLLTVALTDSAPLVDARGVPTAEQVGAGREAAYQLRNRGKSLGGAATINWGPAHLDGVSALATHGFRPGRLNLSARDGAFHVTGSKALPLGRWLNVDLAARHKDAGFPETRLKIGSLPLPPVLTRAFLDAGRWLLRLQGTDLPPLDDLVRNFTVSGGRIVATVEVPAKSALIERLAGLNGSIDPAAVLAVYCRLNKAQAAQPQPDFAGQLRRAFPTANAAATTPDTNRAAFIALAMIVVDRRVGFLAQVDDGMAATCARPQEGFLLHGRSDLPKHWALSAALAAGTGEQMAEAMGVWKELADSLSSRSQFRRGQPTGFSFIDLAADRSGFHIASAAASAQEAGDVARRLSAATADRLLPPALMDEAEGLKGTDFERVYGGIDDPRYVQAVGRIDAVLDRDGLLRR